MLRRPRVKYVVLGMFLGQGVGLLIGFALGNPGAWSGVGLGMGLLLGVLLPAEHRRTAPTQQSFVVGGSGKSRAASPELRSTGRGEIEGPAVLRKFVYRHEAEVTKNLLEANGIESFVTSDDCGALGPSLQFVKGTLLLVASTDVERATEVLDASGLNAPTE